MKLCTLAPSAELQRKTNAALKFWLFRIYSGDQQYLQDKRMQKTVQFISFTSRSLSFHSKKFLQQDRKTQHRAKGKKKSSSTNILARPQIYYTG